MVNLKLQFAFGFVICFMVAETTLNAQDGQSFKKYDQVIKQFCRESFGIHLKATATGAQQYEGQPASSMTVSFELLTSESGHRRRFKSQSLRKESGSNEEFATHCESIFDDKIGVYNYLSYGPKDAESANDWNSILTCFVKEFQLGDAFLDLPGFGFGVSLPDSALLENYLKDSSKSLVADKETEIVTYSSPKLGTLKVEFRKGKISSFSILKKSDDIVVLDEDAKPLKEFMIAQGEPKSAITTRVLDIEYQGHRINKFKVETEELGTKGSRFTSHYVVQINEWNELDSAIDNILSVAKKKMRPVIDIYVLDDPNVNYKFDKEGYLRKVVDLK